MDICPVSFFFLAYIVATTVLFQLPTQLRSALILGRWVLASKTGFHTRQVDGKNYHFSR